MMDYTLIRSNRKTIAMQVKDGKLIVRAPIKAAKRDVDAAVAKFEPELEAMLKNNIALIERRAAFSLNYGDTVLYRGKEYPIAARPGGRVCFDDANGEFCVPSNLSPELIKAAVVQLYKMLAGRHLAGRLLHFQPLLGVSVTNFHITNAKGRWGSMSRRKSVSFSWRLILADDDIIDCVVVHELAHIKEFNHSKAFWAEVEKIIPDWREREARLRSLSRKINAENWDVDRKAASMAESVPSADSPSAYRRHFADYKTILSPQNGI
ncbi:MAG: M48 family metallopeptidase [Oscillospiraceae bacterium]|jgi:predicted metal-dependent hydrolase|nr:M48 family metallopeptidase [Oscillospiraceae bacterium]